MAQGFAPQPGSRPDPYAPQYAPPTAATAQPQGQPSAIGLPPVPSLSGQAQPAPAPYQPGMQQPYVPYRPAPSAVQQPPQGSLRYPLGPAEQPPVAPPASAQPPQNAQPPIPNQSIPLQPGPPQPGAAANGEVGEANTSDKDIFQPGQIVAVVGNQYILYGDVQSQLHQYIAPAYAKAKSQAEIEQIDAARDKLARQILDSMVTNKLMYLEFIREVEKKAGANADEAKADIAIKIRENFDRELISTHQKVLEATPEELEELMKKDPYIPRLAVMMKENDLLLLADLDAFLRKGGSSLEKQRRAWGEYNIGRMGIRDKVNLNPEVSHQEMIDYYREHIGEFGVLAKAKFEILTVRFDKFPSKEAAWQAIAAMGNEVFFGAPFAAVAKKSSQDPNAAKGGQYDWTNQGSLASEVIDQAIFSLEVGKLSQILEDDRGFHIVRVVERQDAGQVPFVEAQKKIKEAIIAAKKDKEFKAYAAGLKSKTPVWTIYDEATEVADAPRTNLAPR